MSVRNKYMKAVRMLNRRCNRIVDGTITKKFENKEELLQDLDWFLTHCATTIDYANVQGVLDWWDVIGLKEHICRKILRTCVEKGFMDPGTDKYKTAADRIGYTWPTNEFYREPRPWLLPGWKTPWQLRDEWVEWKEKKKARLGEA